MSIGQAPTENRDNIRTPKSNCMPASVEHWIKLHWICLPTYQSRESPYYMPLSKPMFSLLGLDLRYGFEMLKCMQTTKELREEVMGYGVYECKTLHERKWTFVPFVTALGSSYRPAMIATWPGRDSVGGRAWDTPHRPLLCMMLCRYGALGLPVVSISKNLSALIPSAVPNPANSHYQIHNLFRSLLMSFDLFLYDRVEKLNRSNLFPIPDFREFLEGQVPRLPNRSRCKEQHPGVAASFRSQGNHRNQIFSVISQDIEEQVATDYSIIATWIWHLQPLWVREISRIHIEFLFRKFAAIESKEKGLQISKSGVHLEQFNKPNLVCLHEMEKRPNLVEP